MTRAQRISRNLGEPYDRGTGIELVCHGNCLDQQDTPVLVLARHHKAPTPVDSAARFLAGHIGSTFSLYKHGSTVIIAEA